MPPWIRPPARPSHPPGHPAASRHPTQGAAPWQPGRLARLLQDLRDPERTLQRATVVLLGTPEACQAVLRGAMALVTAHDPRVTLNERDWANLNPGRRGHGPAFPEQVAEAVAEHAITLIRNHPALQDTTPPARFGLTTLARKRAWQAHPSLTPEQDEALDALALNTLSGQVIATGTGLHFKGASHWAALITDLIFVHANHETPDTNIDLVCDLVHSWLEPKKN